MDPDGFAIPAPKKELPVQNNSVSPPPPPILNKKRKRPQSDIENNDELRHPSKKAKLSSLIYSSPSWEELPPSSYKFSLEIIKNGVSIKNISLNKKGHFIFGRDTLNVDIQILHPSCSRNHAVLQHKKNGKWFIFDFGSTHFTKLNNKKLFPHKYYKICVGDIIKFGTSQRMYVLNGPKQLLPPELIDVNTKKSSKNSNNSNSNSNTMQSMINELKQKSKTQRIKTPGYKSPKRSINVWGLNDDIDIDMNVNNIYFDADEAKTNNLTKDLYKSLKSKEKQLKNMKNHLNNLETKQSNKALNQIECMKIEKLRIKIDKFEDDIYGLNEKISQKLNKNNDHHAFEYYGNYDDDDDDFYDRVKRIRRRQNKNPQYNNIIKHHHALSRDKRINDNNKNEMRDYDSYCDELEKIDFRITEIQQTLRDIQYRKERNICDNHSNVNGEIDQILNDFRVNENKYNALKNELSELENDRKISIKMVNLLRPAYFAVMEKEPDRINDNDNDNKHIYSPHKKLINIVPAAGSNADIVNKMKYNKMKEKEIEKDIENRAKERIQNRFKEINDVRLKAIKEFENEQKKMKQKRKLKQLKENEIKNGIGLILPKKYGNDNNDNNNNKNKLEKEFAKLQNSSSLIKNMFNNGDIEQQQQGIDDVDFIKDNNSSWVPPQNQSGDGKTWLNDKFGY